MTLYYAGLSRLRMPLRLVMPPDQKFPSSDTQKRGLTS